MIEVIKFKAEHMEALIEQEAYKPLRTYVGPEQVKKLENSDMTFTGINECGKIVFCAGVVEYWENRGEAWVVLDHNSRKDFLAIHNSMKRFLEVCPVRRIEAAVDCDFKEGHRWVKALGFKLEAPRLKAFKPYGGDCALYARVR